MQVRCQVLRTIVTILQVLYNKDCVSDQAIIYWYQKGSKPQGRQHFLKATEGLVKVLYTDVIRSHLLPPSDAPTSFCRSRKTARKSKQKTENRVYFLRLVSLCIYIQFGARTFGHIIRDAAGWVVLALSLYPSTPIDEAGFQE
jgi:hypothetical protein